MWTAAVVGGVAVVAALIAVAVGIADESGSDSDVPAASEWAAERRAERAAQTDDEDRRQADESAAVETAEESSSAEAAEREAAEEASRVVAEEERRVAEEAEQEAAEAELQDPDNYGSLTDREWAQIERDPDSHTGERFVLYGHVIQFDANTGPTSFMALTSGEPKGNWYDYTVNTLIEGRTLETIDEVVKGDLVTLYVEILGFTSYTTVGGGFNTVPHVRVNTLSVDGSA